MNKIGLAFWLCIDAILAGLSVLATGGWKYLVAAVTFTVLVRQAFRIFIHAENEENKKRQWEAHTVRLLKQKDEAWKRRLHKANIKFVLR